MIRSYLLRMCIPMLLKYHHTTTIGDRWAFEMPTGHMLQYQSIRSDDSGLPAVWWTPHWGIGTLRELGFNVSSMKMR